MKWIGNTWFFLINNLSSTRQIRIQSAKRQATQQNNTTFFNNLPLFSSKTKNYPSFFLTWVQNYSSHQSVSCFSNSRTHTAHTDTLPLSWLTTPHRIHKANFTPRQWHTSPMKKKKMSKRNQKTRQNHHHQIVFFPCLVVFSVVMVGFVCLFLSLLPPSPNHFGIATKAEAPAKKTDRDSNNSNENEIINKKKQTTTQSEASATSLRILLQKDNSTR